MVDDCPETRDAGTAEGWTGISSYRSFSLKPAERASVLILTAAIRFPENEAPSLHFHDLSSPCSLDVEITRDVSNPTSLSPHGAPPLPRPGTVVFFCSSTFFPPLFRHFFLPPFFLVYYYCYFCWNVYFFFIIFLSELPPLPHPVPTAFS